ncbi:MAG TPA: BON domain-containing protein [Clostridia bacterium]|nr:BON domain-containing protein [Clostridia bacterium]
MSSIFGSSLRLGAVGLAVAVIGLSGCKSGGDRTASERFRDSQVARSVKGALADDPYFKYPDVVANVYDGNVQLSGFVRTTEQRQRAAELASHVRGAKQVVNEILIRPSPTGPASVRDPLGRGTGSVMIDTNAPVPSVRDLPSSQSTPQQPQQPQQPTQQPGSTGDQTNPEQ